MAPPRDEDWSDSDEEDSGEVETSVLLGVPDGLIDAEADINDVAVSRIGGHPAFLASEPPLSSSQCKVCSNPMELLVQMWCPFENSPMDRALYMWGCSRAGCQGKEATVRAWRGLRFNDRYAAQLEKKRERQRQREQERAEALAEEARKKAAAKANPFSVKGSAPVTNPFGLGAQVFGDITPPLASEFPAFGDSKGEEDCGPESESEEEKEDEEEDSLVTAMAGTTISDSVWKSAPSYPSLYLSTLSEYIPAKPKAVLPPGIQILDPVGDEKDSKEGSWASESYENSLEIDQVFDKFSKRVEIEPEQCVRYDLKGTPLPFSSEDAAFKKVFPDPKQEAISVTKAAFNVTLPQKRVYNPSAIPKCPSCGSPRVFECQLMPNLINVLSSSNTGLEKNMTDEERRKLVERALKRGDQDARGSMEWGTCLVFSCEKDCCLDDDKKDTRNAWREEYVLVQWDT